AFSPDGQRLVTATGDFSDGEFSRFGDVIEPQSDTRRAGAAQVWEAETGRPITPPIPHEGLVQRASFSPDGRWILTTCVGRAPNRYQVQVWNAASGRPVCAALLHPRSVFHETLSPDGRMVATGCADGATRVWDAGSGQVLLVLRKHSGPVRHVAFS